MTPRTFPLVLTFLGTYTYTMYSTWLPLGTWFRCRRCNLTMNNEWWWWWWPFYASCVCGRDFSLSFSLGGTATIAGAVLSPLFSNIYVLSTSIALPFFLLPPLKRRTEKINTYCGAVFLLFCLDSLLYCNFVCTYIYNRTYALPSSLDSVKPHFISAFHFITTFDFNQWIPKPKL